MDYKKVNDKIIIEFSNNEALVLSDWLHRFNENEKLDKQIVDQTEERVLCDLDSCFEKSIDVLFSPDYSKLLDLARKDVRE